MDVGAGSGILSLFAATAGAQAVYAIEASDVATAARKLVAKNGLDHIVTVYLLSSRSTWCKGVLKTWMISV